MASHSTAEAWAKAAWTPGISNSGFKRPKSWIRPLYSVRVVAFHRESCLGQYRGNPPVGDALDRERSSMGKELRTASPEMAFRVPLGDRVRYHQFFFLPSNSRIW